MAMLPRNPGDDFPCKRKRSSETMILDLKLEFLCDIMNSYEANLQNTYISFRERRCSMDKDFIITFLALLIALIKAFN